MVAYAATSRLIWQPSINGSRGRHAHDGTGLEYPREVEWLARDELEAPHGLHRDRHVGATGDALDRAIMEHTTGMHALLGARRYWQKWEFQRRGLGSYILRNGLPPAMLASRSRPPAREEVERLFAKPEYQPLPQSSKPGPSTPCLKGRSKPPPTGTPKQAQSFNTVKLIFSASTALTPIARLRNRICLEVRG